MSLGEFEDFRKRLFQIEFQANSAEDFVFEIERSEFEKNRLEKLIALAECVGGNALEMRLDDWKHELQRIQAINMKLQSNKPISSPPRPDDAIPPELQK